MANVNKEIKEEGEKAVELRKENDSKVETPTLDDATKDILTTKDELQLLSKGEIKSDQVDETTNALWEKYSAFTDKQKEDLIKVYGSEENFFNFLAVVKQCEGKLKDDDGNNLSLSEVFLNPEGYSDLAKNVEKYIVKDGEEEKYDQNKVLEDLNNLNISTADDIAKMLAYFSMLGDEGKEYLGANFADTIYDNNLTEEEMDNFVKVLSAMGYSGFEA